VKTTITHNIGIGVTQHDAVIDNDDGSALLHVLYTCASTETARVTVIDRRSGEELATRGPCAAMYQLFVALTADQAAPVAQPVDAAEAAIQVHVLVSETAAIDNWPGRRPLDAAMTGWDTDYVYTPEPRSEGETLVMPAARRLRFALGGD